MTTKMLLPMEDIPGVIRESVRAVLRAHGFAIARTELHGGPPYATYHALDADGLDAVLRECGNNATASLWSIDENLFGSKEHDGAGAHLPATPQPAPSCSGCTPPAADLLAVGETLRALAAAGRPNPDTAEVLARVGQWLADTARAKLAKGRAA